MKPNLMIVGFPRSGTTVLAEYLDRHPEITFPIVRDPNSLATDIIRETIKFHKENKFFPYADKMKYLSLFSNLKNLYIGEASPTYIFSKEAPKNIYNLNPQTKIIILVREPIEFLHSLHSFYLRDMIENVSSFEKALRLEPLRKKGRHIPPFCVAPFYLYYSEIVKYHQYIKNYYEIFPKDDIKIIIYEEFKKDNKKSLNEICRFLNVEPFENIELIMKNENKVPRFKFLSKTFLTNPSFKTFFRKRMNPRVYKKIANSVQNILLKSQKRKPLESNLRVRLMKQYKPEVEELSAFLNKDLVSFWGYDKV